MQLLGILVLILLISIYGLVALSTEDLVWFWPKFDARPTAMVIHCYGRDVVVDRETAAFDQIAALVNQGLSGPKRWDPLSLSEATYQDYLTSSKMMTLELFYTPPVRVHSQYKFFSNVETLVIPLDGRHAQARVVFGRSGGSSGAGSLQFKTTKQIAAYLNQTGLCTKP